MPATDNVFTHPRTVTTETHARLIAAQVPEYATTLPLFVTTTIHALRMSALAAHATTSTMLLLMVIDVWRVAVVRALQVTHAIPKSASTMLASLSPSTATITTPVPTMRALPSTSPQPSATTPPFPAPPLMHATPPTATSPRDAATPQSTATTRILALRIHAQEETAPTL
jgi:hypothetical protein